MYKDRLKKEQAFMDDLNKTYMTFVEFIENPARMGAVGIMCKLKPSSKELIKAKLLDEWALTDNDLRKALYRMRKVMGWFKDIPDGFER